MAKDKEIYYCTMQKSPKCKKANGFLTSKDFYSTANEEIFHNGKLPICKHCLKQYVYNSDKEIDLDKFKNILQVYDIPFYEKEWNVSKSGRYETLGAYMKNVYLNYKDKHWKDGDIDNNVQLIEENETNDLDSIDFWGEGYSESEYRFLNKEYENLITRYECDSYSQEMLFQDIAFQRLEIRKKRQKGSSVDKELKTLQDLLGSANVKPAQENASMASEQVTIGTLIKKYENEKPIPPPLPEWMTADWIKKYVVVWFFGNMCRMMGKPNPFKKEYDEELAKYTVSIDEEGED
ncbi:hypothetical protein ACSW9O_16110 (plasmid) [Clostridium perfringens]